MQKNIDLNLYKVFIKVYDLKSISRASEDLFVSQPSISYSIKELENQLNIKLFYRNSKGVEPTAEAKKLYYYISNAFNTIESGEKMLTDFSDLKSGVIRIGVPTHIGTCFLSQYIENFNRMYPGIKYEIINLSTSNMIYMLETRKLDLIVDNLPIESNRFKLDVYNLIDLENCFVASKKYFGYLKNNIKIKDLDKLPFIISNSNSSIRRELDKYLEKFNVKINSIIDAWTTETMIDFVKRGMGVGYFIKKSVVDLIETGDFITFDFNHSLPKIKVCIAYIPEFQTFASREFINYLKDCVNNEKWKRIVVKRWKTN